MKTELWGRREKAGASDGKLVQARYRYGRKNRHATGRREADRKKSREAGELAAEKSRYCFS